MGGGGEGVEGLKTKGRLRNFSKGDGGGGREFDPAFFLRFGWNLVGKGNCDF